MNLKGEIQKIENIQFGFDISLAEEKLNKIILLVDYIESRFFKKGDDIPREDIISVLQQVYGISYEIGNTKQSLQSNKVTELAKRILPIARVIYNKKRDLLPYLYLNLNNSIGDEKIHQSLSQEISQIENQNEL